MNFSIIDYYDDPDFLTNAAAIKLLNEGRLLQPDQLVSVPDKDFGLIIKTAAGEHRKFPCYNYESTILSAAYFARENILNDEMKKVAGWFIGKKCSEYGLPFDNSFDKVASVYVKEPEAYPQEAELDAKEAYAIASNWFLTRMHTMYPDERVIQAAVLEKTAAAIDEPLDSRIYDYVPKERYLPTGTFVEQMKHRERLVKEANDPALSEMFMRIVDKMMSVTPVEGAAYLDAFDKHAKFDNIKDAYYTCFSGHNKKAEKPQDATPKGEEETKRSLVEGLAMRPDLLGQFSPAFIELFRTNPWAIYEKARPAVKSIIDANLKLLSDEGENKEFKSGHKWSDKQVENPNDKKSKSCR